MTMQTVPPDNGDTPQRRRFARILFDSRASLHAGGKVFACSVIDLALKGALVALTKSGEGDDASGDHGPPLHSECVLELQLGGQGHSIRMEAIIAHREDGRLGLACEEIDIDSFTELRRLMELNLGDAALLEREFATLCAPPNEV